MKFLSVMLVFLLVIMVGCGKKYSEETYLNEDAAWVEKKEYVTDFLDAIETMDGEFLYQQILEGKVQHVDKETLVAVTDELERGKIVEIKFLQGRYKNKIGYTFPEFITDVAKEREKIRSEQEQKEKEEHALLEKAKAEEEARQEEEKRLLEQLSRETGEGAEIICTMAEGTNAYQKIIGRTKLPEGTHLTIMIADIKKEVVVQKEGKFSALFERTILPIGEQSISIKRIDEEKEIYSSKINVQ